VKLKTALIALVIATLVCDGAVRPKPAQASTSDIILYAAIGLGAYIAIVVIAAYFVFHETDGPVVISEAPRLPERDPAVIRTGRSCPQRADRFTVVCW